MIELGACRGQITSLLRQHTDDPPGDRLLHRVAGLDRERQHRLGIGERGLRFATFRCRLGTQQPEMTNGGRIGIEGERPTRGVHGLPERAEFE